MNDGFGVGMRGEAMAARFEVLAQLGIVVNFAVQHHPQRSIFIRERLMAAGQVDDAQAAKSEAEPGVGENTFIIGTAMNDRLGHAMDELLPDLVPPLVFEYPADSAHRGVFPLFLS